MNAVVKRPRGAALWQAIGTPMALLACVALFLAAGAIAAQTSGAPTQDPAPLGPPLAGAALDRATEEVASLMRCPVCQGLSVADSPSTSAVALKSEVRRMLSLGYSEDQVIAAFERSYGEFIRLEPKAEGFNWMVWLMPIVAFAVGALLIYLRLRPQRPADRNLPPPEDTKPS